MAQPLGGLSKCPPQFAADVSLLLSATADPVVQDLLDAKKLVRDMRRSCAKSHHFHSCNETLWKNSWFVLRGPMRAIVPVQMDLGQEVM